jgi:hypothetical protein
MALYCPSTARDADRDAPSPPAQPAIHYGFIPAVILVGLLATKPRPSVWQLLAPFG